MPFAWACAYGDDEHGLWQAFDVDGVRQQFQEQIDFLRRKQKKGQPIREDGPASHFSKAGTPTMGGLLILSALMVSTLMWARLDNPYVWIVVLVTLAVLVYPSVALPVLLMLTTMVSVAVAPLARLLIVPLTLLPALPAPSPLPLTLSTFSPAGTTSLTVTFAAVLGPALTTTIAKLIVELAVFPLGWLATLLTLRSATAFALLAAVLTLFVGVLSAVVVVTVAGFVTAGTTVLLAGAQREAASYRSGDDQTEIFVAYRYEPRWRRWDGGVQ